MKIRYLKGPHAGSVAVLADAAAKAEIKAKRAEVYVRDPAVAARDRDRNAKGWAPQQPKPRVPKTRARG